MKMGVMVGGTSRSPSLEEMSAEVVELEERGFDTAWVPHVFGYDAVTLTALFGRVTRRIELGTAVVPSFPRHPVALAQQALTAAAACGERFTLGLGLSHPAIIESMLGLSYAQPATHMREYLAVLAPLLRGDPARHRGERYRVNAELLQPREPVGLLLAALGPRMLALAGQQADGTLLWTAGPRTIEDHVGPSIRAAAEAAHRPAPRIVVGMHIVLTDAVDAATARVAKSLALYRQMPSYRAMFEREGSDRVEDLALVGDEGRLERGLDRLEALGVTDFEASLVPSDPGSRERTLAFLAARRRG